MYQEGIDKDNNKKFIINKTLENNKEEELLFEISTSKKQHFIKSNEKSQKNENITFKNKCNIVEGKQGENLFRILKNKESFLKEIYEESDNYKNKEKNENRNIIQITQEDIFMKGKEENSYIKEGILYVTNNKQKSKKGN